MKISNSKIEHRVKLNLLVNCNSTLNIATTGVRFGEYSHFPETFSASQLTREFNSAYL